MSENQALSVVEFGKVAVLFGGWSAERDVSLNSGKAVLEALQKRGVDAHGVDVSRERLLNLKSEGFNTAWIALHGVGGEDGVTQAVLEVQGIPYTGSGVSASALAMDKSRCKAVWASSGIPTPVHRLLKEDSDFEAVAADLGLPIFVKPVGEGSSIGMSLVRAASDLKAAWKTASAFGSQVLAERFVDGPEYTAGILDGKVLPLIRIETNHSFYDYQAKYEADDTQYHCPCGLAPDQEAHLAKLSLQAFDIVGARGWGRVDFMLDSDGQPWFLEINTLPGMTSHSLVPMCAGAAGIDFEELVWRILLTCQTAQEASHATAQ